MLVRETAFVNNKASAKGGAIFNDGWLWIVCSAFVDNKAPLGCVPCAYVSLISMCRCVVM